MILSKGFSIKFDNYQKEKKLILDTNSCQHFSHVRRKTAFKSRKRQGRPVGVCLNSKENCSLDSIDKLRTLYLKGCEIPGKEEFSESGTSKEIFLLMVVDNEKSRGGVNAVSDSFTILRHVHAT